MAQTGWLQGDARCTGLRLIRAACERPTGEKQSGLTVRVSSALCYPSPMHSRKLYLNTLLAAHSARPQLAGNIMRALYT